MQKKSILVLLVCLCAVLCFPRPGSAQENGFSEDFENPSIEGWEISPQTHITNGVLQIESGGFALHFGDWSDITLQVRVKYTGEGTTVVAYYHRDVGGYKLVLTSGLVSLIKMTNEGETPLGTSPANDIQPDTWFDVKIVVAGAQHQVFINNSLQISTSDPQPLETGAVLLMTGDGVTAEFDDLSVTGTPGMPPEPGNVIGEPAATPVPVETVVPAASVQNLDSFIQEFFSSQANTLELTTFLINLALAAICAYILGLVYIYWGTSLSNRRKFASNFLLMTITTTFIILVVRSSVALSLGLVGALSIVRFRTAVKEPEELAYLFFAIGIGIGLGDNQRLITLLALVVGIALLGLRRLFRRTEADVNLHLSVTGRGDGKVDLEKITEALRPHVSKIKLLRLDENRDSLEAGFLVEFTKAGNINQARDALRALSDSLEITFMDNKGIW